MKLKEGLEAQYREYVRINSDGYSAMVVSFGENWANRMERRLETEAGGIEGMARETSREADTDGITLFMYGCAVSALAHFWIHGEDLRRVLNPALKDGHGRLA